MAFKAVLFCAFVLLVQDIAGQALRGINTPSCSTVTGSNSSPISNNPLIVTSVSPIAPTGIAVSSDLDLQGDLEITGTLPFVSSVFFSDTLPTSGSGTVDYGCGSISEVAITGVTGGSLGGGSCGK